MCGLVGILGNPSNKMTKTFVDMLRIDQIRGDDSTGVVAISRRRMHYIKDIGGPETLFYHNDWARVMNPTKQKFFNYCLMGHNRLATKGIVSYKNAHPFHHGNIVMTHNGTLHSVYEIKQGQEFDTDSEHICYAVNQLGIESVWKKLYGAAALVWWDINTKKLHMITNGKRELNFAFTEDKKHLLWASEDWIMKFSALRRDLKFDENSVVSMEKDILHTFEWDWKHQKLKHESRRLSKTRHVGFIPNTGHHQPGKERNFSRIGWGYGGLEPWQGELDEGDEWMRDCVARRDAHLAEIKGGSLQDDERKPEPNLLTHQPDGTAVPDPAPEPNLHNEELLSEEEFKANYPFCFLCSSPLEHEYKEAEIVDIDKAACRECVDTAHFSGIDLHLVNPS